MTATRHLILLGVVGVLLAGSDENTSRSVGSASLRLDDATTSPLVLTIPVDRQPHVDEDGVAARSMALTD